MTDITITIPIGFTVADIVRANPKIGESEALELAQKLHAIIAVVQTSYSTRPPSRDEMVRRSPGVAKRLLDTDLLAFEQADLIESLRRTAVGIWPADNQEEEDVSIWLAEILSDLGGDNFYLQYLQLCDQINKTNYADPVFKQATQ